MAQKQALSEQTEKSSLLSLAPADLAAAAKERMAEFANAQSELLDKFQETHRQWLDRIEAETNLASELASKLTAARSLPDAMTACQEWGNRRFEMMTEDTKHLFDDTQQFMRTGVRLLSTGWQSQGSNLAA